MSGRRVSAGRTVNDGAETASASPREPVLSTPTRSKSAELTQRSNAKRSARPQSSRRKTQQSSSAARIGRARCSSERDRHSARHAGNASAAGLFRTASPIAPSGIEGLTLAPADTSLTDVDRGDAAAISTLRQNLAAANEHFDVCVIDTAPSLGLRSVAALVAATHVLSPIYLEDYSVKGVKGLLQTFVGVQKRYGRSDATFLGLLPSLFNSKSPRQRAHLEQLLRTRANISSPATSWRATATRKRSPNERLYGH